MPVDLSPASQAHLARTAGGQNQELEGQLRGQPSAARLDGLEAIGKANYGRFGAEMTLTWTDGVFVRDVEPSGLDRLVAESKAERVFLSLIDTLAAQGRYVSVQPGPTYAPAIFAKHPDAEGCIKRALASAMESLLSRKTTVIGWHGKGSDKRSHLERAGHNPGPNLGHNAVTTPVTTPAQPLPTASQHTPLITLALRPP